MEFCEGEVKAAVIAPSTFPTVAPSVVAPSSNNQEIATSSISSHQLDNGEIITANNSTSPKEFLSIQHQPKTQEENVSSSTAEIVVPQPENQVIATTTTEDHNHIITSEIPSITMQHLKRTHTTLMAVVAEQPSINLDDTATAYEPPITLTAFDVATKEGDEISTAFINLVDVPIVGVTATLTESTDQCTTTAIASAAEVSVNSVTTLSPRPTNAIIICDGEEYTFNGYYLNATITSEEDVFKILSTVPGNPYVFIDNYQGVLPKVRAIASKRDYYSFCKVYESLASTNKVVILWEESLGSTIVETITFSILNQLVENRLLWIQGTFVPPNCQPFSSNQTSAADASRVSRDPLQCTSSLAASALSKDLAAKHKAEIAAAQTSLSITVLEGCENILVDKPEDSNPGSAASIALLASNSDSIGLTAALIDLSKAHDDDGNCGDSVDGDEDNNAGMFAFFLY